MHLYVKCYMLHLDAFLNCIIFRFSFAYVNDLNKLILEPVSLRGSRHELYSTNKYRKAFDSYLS